MPKTKPDIDEQAVIDPDITLYTHEQAAKKLGIHPATLHLWRQRGWISVCKRGRWIRYTGEALATAVKDAEIKADGHPPPRRSKGGS